MKLLVKILVALSVLGDPIVLIPYAFGRALLRYVRDLAWTFRYKGDPVLYVHPRHSVVHGRIIQRSGATVLAETYAHDLFDTSGTRRSAPLYLLDAELNLADEGVTWCRGHEGEGPDAFRAFAAMESNSTRAPEYAGVCGVRYPKDQRALCVRWRGHTDEHEALGFKWT